MGKFFSKESTEEGANDVEDENVDGAESHDHEAYPMTGIELEGNAPKGISDSPGAAEKGRQQQNDVKSNSRLSLHEAARNGDTSTLNKILSKDNRQKTKEDKLWVKKINYFDKDKMSPLHHAIRHNHLEAVRILVDDYGADVNLKTEDDVTPRHIAARYIGENNNQQNAGNVKVISYLRTKKAMINAKDVYGSTPLHFAAMRKDGDVEELVRELNECKQKADVEAKDNQGMTPLHVACMHRNYEVVQRLLSEKADVLAEDKEKRTPFHLACLAGSVEICEFLLNKFVPTDNSNSKRNIEKMLFGEDQSGSTAIHHAVQSGSEECVKLCLKENKTPQTILADSLGMATKQTDGAIFKILLEKLVYTDNNVMQRAIHLAATHNNKDIIELLVKRLVAIESVDDDKRTALLIASRHGCSAVVEYLLNVANADLTKTDINGKSAVFLAAENGSTGGLETMKELLACGAIINAKNFEENTPIHLAAKYDRDEIVKKLIEKGTEILSKADEENEENSVSGTTGAVQQGDGKNQTEKGAEMLIRKTDEKAQYSGKSKLNKDKKGVSKKSVHDGKIQKMEDKISTEKTVESHRVEVNKYNDEDYNISPNPTESGVSPNESGDKSYKHKKAIVMAQNDVMNTPLHLAALGGHLKTVELLIEKGADVMARNAILWTPLDCAASNGRPNCVKTLINAMHKIAFSIDPEDKSKNTPLHLAARNGHKEVVHILLDKNANIRKKNLKGKNCLDLAIEYNHQEVAMVIVEHPKWKDVMRNVNIDEETNNYDTPMRKMIRKMPEVAKKVLDKGICGNKKDPSDVQYAITFDFSFIDDTFVNFGKALKDSARFDDISPYEENGDLKNDVKLNAKNAHLKLNHPLTLMVKHKRSNLIAHPLVTSLIRHKWNAYSGYFYYTGLFIYVLFVAFLTGYVLTTPPPYYFNRDNGTLVWKANGEEKYGQEANSYVQPTFTVVCKWAVIGLTGFNMLKELIQMMIRSLEYVTPENIIEWLIFILTLLFLANFVEEQHTSGLRYEWQWYCGVFAMFFAWLDLIIFIRKLAYVGIYVVMFIDVFKTFCRFSIILTLFLMAFALSFYALLMNQPTFSSPGYALMKTFVMMTGEFGYDEIFHATTYLDEIERNEDVFAEMIWYEALTYIMFTIFLVIAAILIMNLLVGLAVDDIKGVQELAVLKKHALQVELALDVEQMLPPYIRKKVFRKSTEIYPNKIHTTGVRRLFVTASTISAPAIVKSVHPEKTTNEKLLSNQDDIVQIIKTANENLQTKQGKLETDVGELTSKFEVLKNVDERLDRLEEDLKTKLERLERQNNSIEKKLEMIMQNVHGDISVA
ncbi:transient receptor potential cation channel subfamily A member 1-like [Glandiceps talaboti]